MDQVANRCDLVFAHRIRARGIASARSRADILMDTFALAPEDTSEETAQYVSVPSDFQLIVNFSHFVIPLHFLAVPTLTCEPAMIICIIPKAFYAEYDLGGKNSYIYMSPSADGISESNSVCKGNLPSF